VFAEQIIDDLLPEHTQLAVVLYEHDPDLFAGLLDLLRLRIIHELTVALDLETQVLFALPTRFVSFGLLLACILDDVFQFWHLAGLPVF